MSSKDQALALDLINDAAIKILGWDKNTLALNFNRLLQLDSSLGDFSIALARLDDNKKDFSINNQNYILYNTKLKNDFYLVEIHPVVYQDLKQTTHELKRPIQNIKTLVETLILGAKDDIEKRDEYLNKLNFEADRLSTMVQDLLSLNRLLSQNLELQKRPSKVYDLVNRLLDSALTNARALNIKLENKILPGTEINADQKLLEHLLANLIDNAIKYNQRNGSVTISCDKSLIVADTGTGIEAKDQGKIFEQFYRTQSTSHIQGTGLGLTIVRAITDLHGWTIRVKSDSQGTSFVIDF
jgi:two-component system, OmpR family, phosphate regulon sensor histidine kinase PhoR